MSSCAQACLLSCSRVCVCALSFSLSVLSLSILSPASSFSLSFPLPFRIPWSRWWYQNWNFCPFHIMAFVFFYLCCMTCPWDDPISDQLGISYRDLVLLIWREIWREWKPPWVWHQITGIWTQIQPLLASYSLCLNLKMGSILQDRIDVMSILLCFLNKVTVGFLQPLEWILSVVPRPLGIAFSPHPHLVTQFLKELVVIANVCSL